MPWLEVDNIVHAASGALGTNEDWQVRAGCALVTSQAPPSPDAGVLLDPDGVSIMQFNAGENVRYRLAPGETAARIWREPRP